MQTVALIDYGSGNLHSAERALREAARLAHRTREIRVTADPDFIARADRIVLPGVGHFAHCRQGLEAREGVIAALNEAVIARATPFLGICVGMQLMARRGLEDGDTPGLGWFPGEVARITPPPEFRVPHMGWNALSLVQEGHPVLAGLGDEPHAYFVHSYAYRGADPAHVAATTDHGGPIVAAIARDNLFGTQFHPEKSQETGLRLLANWLVWAP
jgi:glutamine amidotransferase